VVKELCDPASDEAFRAALKQDLGKKVKLIEVDAAINDEAFARIPV
jgi:hypothetical protein